MEFMKLKSRIFVNISFILDVVSCTYPMHKYISTGKRKITNREKWPKQLIFITLMKICIMDWNIGFY